MTCVIDLLLLFAIRCKLVDIITDFLLSLLVHYSLDVKVTSKARCWKLGAKPKR